MFATKRILMIVLMLALIFQVSPGALASYLRVWALGDLGWVIDDDTDNFINPANSAWIQDGYITMNGRANNWKYAENDILMKRYGDLLFIKPTGELAGYQNVLGGQFTVLDGTRDRDNYNPPYVWKANHLYLNLQDAVKINDRLAVGGSFTYNPNPLSEKYSYDNGNVKEYIDSGSQIGLEGGLTYRPTDSGSLEFGVLTLNQNDTKKRYWNGTYTYDLTYSYSSLTIHGKASYALSNQAKVMVALENKGWHENDNGAKSEGSDFLAEFGGTYKPSNRLLLAGSLETGNEDGGNSLYLRGGVEYQLTESVALRGGIINLTNVTQKRGLLYTMGAGLAVGPGQLDLYTLFGADEISKHYTYQAGYTVKF